MRFLFILIVLASLSIANDALPSVLEARYEYVACDVEYAKDWLSMREDCAEEQNVTVFDSSDNVDDLEDDLSDLKEEAEEGDRLGFGLSTLKIGADFLVLIGDIIKDAFDGKNLAFFQCVREGEEPLIDDKEDCKEDAIDLEKEAAKDYVENEIEDANELIGVLDTRGMDTSGMEDVVELAEELVDDIDKSYETYDPKEIRKIHLRHSRLIFLFRAEQMLAVIDFTEPIIRASNNDNKDEVLDRMEDLEDDVKDLIDECEYSDDVEDNYDYARQNLDCWDEGLDLLKEFNSIRLLILEGA